VWPSLACLFTQWLGHANVGTKCDSPAPNWELKLRTFKALVESVPPAHKCGERHRVLCSGASEHSSASRHSDKTSRLVSSSLIAFAMASYSRLSGVRQVLWGATRSRAGYSNRESSWSSSDVQQYFAARLHTDNEPSYLCGALFCRLRRNLFWSAFRK